jgi:Tfp pilus assembly protein PilF
LIAGAGVAGAQGPRATVREVREAFTTYPFSDPDPVPRFGRLYPYFRFDGYTDRSERREWTVVELENAHLRVRVLPEIGGKIWTAIDKASGRPFLYENRVVKFRDIAMRGPWTSGGLEANYGIIGHTPNCATPVDYATRVEADGTAVVTIGTLDLLTRTAWRLEIALPPDAAYFTTRSVWQNGTPLEQPYYTWMNAALRAGGGLQFVYPGTRAIGHAGETVVADWPRRAGDGRDLSTYARNDFGGYKSYHVLGGATDFFGAYFNDEDAGMVRYAPRDEKPGKKIWIWGLSGQGTIWERLLTDDDGQYVEVQSGRLFNQAATASSLTPFTQRGFTPAATDTWTEYWYPVAGTRGLVAASDLGALNVTRDAGGLVLAFSPARRVEAEVAVFDGARRVFATHVSLAPRQSWRQAVGLDVPDDRLRVTVGGTGLEYVAAPGHGRLARPTEGPAGFDRDSAYGLFLRGTHLAREREYVAAGTALEQSLARDPHFLPALAALAMLRVRALHDEEAFALATRALAIDTYDPAANHAYGLAAAGLGRTADARDGFEIASQSVEYRGAAHHQLARLALRDGDTIGAERHARRALDVNGLDFVALHTLAVAQRTGGRAAAWRATLSRWRAADQLAHGVRAEEYLAGGRDEDARAFVGALRNELPQETVLELATWYHAAGRGEDAGALLRLAPAGPEVLAWRAFLAHERGDEAASRALLAEANAASPWLAFPFRAESAAVFEWARAAGDAWQPSYYLALLHAGLGNAERARAILEACADRPDYAPFYAARAAVRALAPASPAQAAAARHDLERARALDPGQWRYVRLLAEHHLAHDDLPAALAVTGAGTSAFRDNYVLALLHARVLLRSGHAADSASLLARTTVLPYEGATEGRALHREAQLRLAIDALRRGDATAALAQTRSAREWPPNLGAGQPYAADIDERLEDWVAWRALARLGRRRDADTLVAAAVSALSPGSPSSPGRTSPQGPEAGALASALMLRDAGRPAEAERAIAAWRDAMPQSALAEWGTAVFRGANAPPPLPPGAQGDLPLVEAIAATPWP